MEKHFEDLDKSRISKYQKLSKSFMDKHFENLNKSRISAYQKLSEPFIEKHFKDLNKYCISEYQKLSENFMEKHFEDLDKSRISKYQKLSETFMEKHFEDLNKSNISRYQKLSETFRINHNLTIDEDNWLYKSKDFKLNYLKSISTYEIIDDDYIIAYKSVRDDYYSVYNFQYFYQVGKTYESHCDCSSEENSFGLSAWTKEEAINYHKGRLLKVKINIEDIGRIVHDNHKIRCSKMQIVEEVEL